MCHYHSISVNRQGNIAHVASNSHSEAVEKAGWRENTAEHTYHWNFEYNPSVGEVPGWDYSGALACMVGDGYVIKPSQKVLNAADDHFEKLIAFHKGEKEYADYFFHEDDVMDKALSCDRISQDMLIYCYKMGPSYSKNVIASNTSTPTNILEELSNYNDIYILLKVASNPSTPEHVLSKLSVHADDRVVCCVGHNPTTPKDVILKLVNHPYWMVRHSIATNKNTNIDLLIRLRDNDISPTVRKHAGNKLNIMKRENTHKTFT